jgi:hypothetical protein
MTLLAIEITYRTGQTRAELVYIAERCQQADTVGESWDDDRIKRRRDVYINCNRSRSNKIPSHSPLLGLSCITDVQLCVYQCVSPLSLA